MSRLNNVYAIPDETEIIILYNKDEVYLAKKEEIDNWIKNDVFEEVLEEIINLKKHKVISVRWVITEKLKDGRIIIKARLVVRGFEEDSSNLKKGFTNLL